MDRSSYRMFEKKTLLDLVWTGIFYDDNPGPFPPEVPVDEEHPVSNCRYTPRTVDTARAEITAHVLFFLDDLRDSVNEKNLGAGIERSVPSRVVEVAMESVKLTSCKPPSIQVRGTRKRFP